MAVVAAAGEAAGAATAESAPVLVAVRAQALLIAPLRLALAGGGLAGARILGAGSGTAAGSFAIGAAVIVFGIAASGRRRRAWDEIDAATPATGVTAVEPLWRSLAAATFPSTITVTVLLGIALAKDALLAALLAGVLAGLGLAALAFAAQVWLWERGKAGRLLAERGRGGRVVVALDRAAR